MYKVKSATNTNNHSILPQAQISAVVQALERRINSIDKSFSEARRDLNELQQYLRRQNLLIHGLDDVPLDKYDLDFIKYIVDKLNAMLDLGFGKITVDDINDAHPMYKSDKSKSKYPVVIVQFNKRWLRNEILKKRINYVYRLLASQNI